MLVTKEHIDLDELEKAAWGHTVAVNIKAQIEDLGDISGHTLVVTLPIISEEQMTRIRNNLTDMLPDDVTIIVTVDDVKIEVGDRS